MILIKKITIIRAFSMKLDFTVKLLSSRKAYAVGLDPYRSIVDISVNYTRW